MGFWLTILKFRAPFNVIRAKSPFFGIHYEDFCLKNEKNLEKLPFIVKNNEVLGALILIFEDVCVENFLKILSALAFFV